MSINVIKGEEKVNYKIGVGSIVKSKSDCAVLNSESLFMILDDINEGCYRLVNINTHNTISSLHYLITISNSLLINCILSSLFKDLIVG